MCVGLLRIVAKASQTIVGRLARTSFALTSPSPPVDLSAIKRAEKLEQEWPEKLDRNGNPPVAIASSGDARDVRDHRGHASLTTFASNRASTRRDNLGRG